MLRSAKRALGLLAAAFGAGLIFAAPASGQGASLGTDLVPWPELLPPASVSDDTRPGPVEHCREGRARCVAGLARRLARQWRRFDATCDHRAVIAYSYLEITRGLLADLRGPRPGLVRHRRWMAYLITNFSNRYFRAFERWEKGRPLTEAWRITFATAARGDVQAGQEVLLFSNVHVQHDLPFAYERMGIRTRSGASRKADHDAVNEINARVFDGIEKYIAANYDPSFSLIDTPVFAAEELATLELVKLWRENAWRSAERLVAAESPAERSDVAATIAASAGNWARMIAAFQLPGYGAARDEFCRSH
jgi:hypothetical protein